MLRIGEFSQLSQVTVKTLRHYDKLGLLSPAQIDELSNYRYYALEQLPRIHRIMALKELGLSLEQIGAMLEDEISTDNIRGMLALKQAEIKQQVHEAQRQLALVEFRLRMINAEDDFPPLDVVMKSLEAKRFLSFFVDSPQNFEHAMRTMARVSNTLNEAIKRRVIDFAGVTYDVFHGDDILPFSSSELHDRQHEILLEVSANQEAVTLEGIGNLSIREEPPIALAATLILQEDGQGKGHEKAILLRRWAFAQGYRPHSVMRYLAHRGPLQTLNMEEFIVEAQLPVDAITDSA